MKITPLDIKKQEFSMKFRGYSPDEVNSFLEMIASELEDAHRKNLELEQKITSLEERLAGYARMESILQETLITTQRAAEETRTTAEKKAEAITSEARITAHKITAETNEKLLNIQREIADLNNQRDTFVISLRSLLESQIALLDLMDKKQGGKEEYVPARKKTDLTDDELDEIVNEFERKLSSEKDPRKRL